MTRSILSLSLFFAVSTSALGQDRFSQWDKNGDGKLAKEELPEQLRRNFERVDKNGDGFISKEEHLAVGNRGGSQRGGIPGMQLIADLDYSGEGNPRQMLDLYLPENYAQLEKPLPLICWIHGGGWKNGSKSGTGILRTILRSGDFAGASIGYRLSDEAQWPSQIHDCKAAIRWLKAHAEEYNFDANRIGIAGSSAGGHLVAMLGVSHGVDHLEGEIGEHTAQDAEVACVVDLYGPTELLTMSDFDSTMDHNAPESPESLLIGGPIQENKEKANDASPIKHISDDDEPFLIIHGTKDPLVSYQQSTAFEKALEEVGVTAILVTVEGGEHGKGFGTKPSEIAEQFLRNQLLGEGELPSDQKVEAVETRR